MEYRFSKRLERAVLAMKRERSRLPQEKGIISFAGSFPAEELFPADAVREAAARVAARGGSSLQYGHTEGYGSLREQIAGRMRAEGMPVEAGSVLLTTGSQQAIDLAAAVLTEAGDAVLVETPASAAMLQLFQMHGLRAIAVQCDEYGMLLEDAERKLIEHKPRLLYAMPTFGNPTGNVWSMERRQGIVALCRAHGVPILEDDAYRGIAFEGYRVHPTLFSLAGEEGGVLYASSFSQAIAPALRTGWAAGDAVVIEMMTRAKQSADRHSSSFDQQIVSELLDGCNLDDHMRRIAAEYDERMHEMQRLLRAERLGDVSWAEPQGGLFLWLQLPEGLDAEALLRCSLGKGTAFAPGAPFYADEPQRNRARLSYTQFSGERLARGIALFAEAIREFTARS